MENDDVDSKLGAVLNLLSGNQQDKQLKSIVLEKLTKDKQDSERKNRYKQKERLYQATPIVIDGLTMDGRKDIVKAIKSAVNLELDTKKPEVKFPWLKMILGLLTFAAGLILGFLAGAISKLREWGKAIGDGFSGIRKRWVDILEKIKNSKVGKFIEELITNLKGKFTELVEKVRNSKLGKFVEEVFTNLKGKFLELVDKVRNSKVGKFIEELFTNIKTKFDDIVKAAREFKPIEFIKGKFAQLTATIDDIFKGITTAVKENKIVKTVLGVFDSIGEFFKPLTDLLPKGAPGGKIGSALKPIFEFFDDIWKAVGGFFKAGFNVGKQIGRALGPLFFIVETIIGLYQSFTDPKLKDKSFIQKALTGFVTGFVEFITGIFQLVGLDLFDFTEIRDRIDKVFSSFKEGFIPGILELLNQLVSSIASIPVKIVGWIVGWFDKDAGDKIKEFGKNFDILKNLKDLWESIKEVVGFVFGWLKETFTWDNIKNTFFESKDFFVNKFKSIGDAFKESMIKVIDWLKSLFTWDTLKEILTNATPIGLAMKGAKILGETFKGKKEEETKTIPVGDLIDDNQRVMYSKRGSYSFDKNDQIVAMKKGGPIEGALKNMDFKTAKSVDQLRDTLGKLSQRLETHFKKTEKLYEAEYKMMNDSNQLLVDIRDKKEASSNVVVNNSSSNMVFSQKTSSNLDYRNNLTNRMFSY